MQKINSLLDIMDNYDLLLVDQVGVIHQDWVYIDSAVATLTKVVAEHNKKTLVLSNSSQRAKATLDNFRENGLQVLADDNVLTSGEFFYQLLDQGQIDLRTKKLYIFNNVTEFAIMPYDHIEVDDISQADIIIAKGVVDSISEPELAKHYQLLDTIAHLNIPMYCINPDVHTLAKNNKLKYVCGVLADYYQKITDAPITYFGKPHPEIYNYIFDKYQVSKDKVLMIGDNMETDIAGAVNVGIDSLLIHKSGVHKDLSIDEIKQQQGQNITYYMDILA